MPSLRRLLSKEVAAVPRPRIYTIKADFHPPSLFEGTVSPPSATVCQAIADGELAPRCSITPDLLPLHLELAQPKTTRATFAFGLDPSSQDTCLSPLVIEAARFPLAIQQFDLAALIAPLAISHSLFQCLATIRVLGMNYRDRVWRELHPLGSTETPIREKGGTKPLSKSYIEPALEQRRGRKSRPKPPSFWDMLYTILQPPLTLEHFENLPLPHELYKYQPAGIDFLMKNESALLADEMGTGKTVMTIVALRILMQRGHAHRALIVCPVSILRQWNDHLADWAPELLVTVVRGNRDARLIDWQMPAHVYVSTYDTLRSDIEAGTLPEDNLGGFDVVVLDEAQNIKNRTSSRSRAIKRLQPRQRWALTGTPIENKLEDLASLFEFLRPGYLTPFDLYSSKIKQKIAPFFLRRRKADVLPDLPSMQKMVIWLELDEAQRAEYDRVAERVRYELSEIGPRVTKMDIMQRIQRLKQICNFAPGQLASPKLDSLKERLEEIIESQQKVIVFSQYLGEGIDKLEDALEPYGTAKIVGGQSDFVRDAQIRRFKQLPDVPVLLASVRAGGVGLNLTEASYVIHFDHWWNPAVMWQAEARVHRPGQTRGVNVYSFWMVNTIEERIYRMLQEKGLLFQDVVDGLAESQVDELISTNEWLEILGVKPEEVQPPSKRETFESLGLTEIRERLYEITPAAFEQLVKELMHSLNYPNVKVTGRTRDGGIDVISTRNTSEGVVRAVAQCKRYRGTVGVEVARELRGVMASDNSIQKGFLVTTGEFTRECLGFCERSGVIVPISGLQVANYVKQFGLAV